MPSDGWGRLRCPHRADFDRPTVRGFAFHLRVGFALLSNGGCAVRVGNFHNLIYFPTSLADVSLMLSPLRCPGRLVFHPQMRQCQAKHPKKRGKRKVFIHGTIGTHGTTGTHGTIGTLVTSRQNLLAWQGYITSYSAQAPHSKTLSRIPNPVKFSGGLRRV